MLKLSFKIGNYALDFDVSHAYLLESHATTDNSLLLDQNIN